VTSESVHLDPGSAVGPYVLERRLGHAGPSVRWIARAPRGGKTVLTLFAADPTGPLARSRLFGDMHTLAEAEHRNVARIEGTGECGGIAWIATEYVQGTDLARLMAGRGALHAEAAVGYATQAAEGLAAAHAAGVLHGALRPSKVLVTPDGRVVLVDFGVPRRSSTEYLSPEQVEQGKVDARTDVWALGCVLFEMLAGEPPFGRGGPATTSAIVRDEPRFLPRVPGTLTAIVSACLRKSAFDRIGSARELANLLRDALDEPAPALASPARRASTAPPRSPSILPARPLSISPPRANGMRVPVLRGRVKGAALRAALAWFVDAYGAQAIARLAELASPDVRSTLSFGEPALGFMPSGWYDTEIVGDLLIAMERAASPPDPDAFIARLAEAIARDNLTGVYRALFRVVASPLLLEANAQRVWRTYVDEGTLTVRILSPGSFEARVRGWSRHHGAVCRILPPMLEQLLRGVGFTTLTVDRTECVAEGRPQCTFDGRWLA